MSFGGHFGFGVSAGSYQTAMLEEGGFSCD